MQELIEQMTQIMTKMMPYMGYIADAGLAMLAAGAFAWLLWLLSGRCTWLLRLSGRLLAVLGVFFLASQVAGLLLGMKPGLNLGDASKSAFDTLPFWMIGAAFLLVGLFMRVFGSLRPTH